MNAQITEQISTEEFIESLTGYEEIAIAKAFGAELFVLAETKQTMFIRALVFIHVKRTGVKDDEAKKTVLGMSLKQAQSHFSDEDLESGEDEPPSE